MLLESEDDSYNKRIIPLLKPLSNIYKTMTADNKQQKDDTEFIQAWHNTVPEPLKEEYVKLIWSKSRGKELSIT